MNFGTVCGPAIPCVSNHLRKKKKAKVDFGLGVPLLLFMRLDTKGLQDKLRPPVPEFRLQYFFWKSLGPWSFETLPDSCQQEMVLFLSYFGTSWWPDLRWIMHPLQGPPCIFGWICSNCCLSCSMPCWPCLRTKVLPLQSWQLQSHRQRKRLSDEWWNHDITWV